MLKLRQKFERRKRMQELRKNKGVSNLNNDEYFKSHPLFNDPDLISQQQAHENLIRKSPFTSLHSEMAGGKSLRSAHLQDVDDLIYATHDHDDGGGVYDDYYAGGNDNGADVGIVGNNNDANLADFNANRGQDDPVEFDMPVPTDDQFYDDEDDPEELARRVDAALSEDLFLLNKSNTYENICKKYVDGFHRSANEYMSRVELAKRVMDWTLKLEPILAAQEDSSPFDIHIYSDNILGDASHIISERRRSLNDPNNIENVIAEELTEETVEQVKFSDLAHGKSTAEVCRLFLSCLQLTNQGNLEILNNSNSDFSHVGNHKADALKTANKANTKRNGKNGKKDQNIVDSQELQDPESLLLSHSAIVNNDVVFKLNSSSRAKEIEEFRAPSVAKLHA